MFYRTSFLFCDPFYEILGSRSIFSSKIILTNKYFLHFFFPPLGFRSKPVYLAEGDYRKGFASPSSTSDIAQVIHAEISDKKRWAESAKLGFSLPRSLVLRRLLHTQFQPLLPFLESPNASSIEECYFFTKLGHLTHLCHWPFKIERFPKENNLFLAQGKNTREVQIPHFKKEETYVCVWWWWWGPGKLSQAGWILSGYCLNQSLR